MESGTKLLAELKSNVTVAKPAATWALMSKLRQACQVQTER